MLMHKVPQAVQVLLRCYSDATQILLRETNTCFRAAPSHLEYRVVLILQTYKTCSERASQLYRFADATRDNAIES
jgi:hypothetical protein